MPPWPTPWRVTGPEHYPPTQIRVTFASKLLSKPTGAAGAAPLGPAALCSIALPAGAGAEAGAEAEGEEEGEGEGREGEEGGRRGGREKGRGGGREGRGGLRPGRVPRKLLSPQNVTLPTDNPKHRRPGSPGHSHCHPPSHLSLRAALHSRARSPVKAQPAFHELESIP